jgi:hypothetical protein
MKTIFDVDSTSTTTFEEEADGTVHIEKTMDAEPILNVNKREYHTGVNNPTSSALGRKVASVPLVVWQNWMKSSNGEVGTDPKVLARYLNDPDNKFLRTHNSRV